MEQETSGLVINVTGRGAHVLLGTIVCAHMGACVRKACPLVPLLKIIVHKIETRKANRPEKLNGVCVCDHLCYSESMFHCA